MQPTHFLSIGLFFLFACLGLVDQSFSAGLLLCFSVGWVRLSVARGFGSDCLSALCTLVE